MKARQNIISINGKPVMIINYETHPNAAKLADWMSAITDDRVKEQDVIWLYSFMTAVEFNETHTIKDWAYILESGIEPATMDDVEVWVRRQAEDSWDEFTEYVERRFYS